ncbi:hypothetical protein DL93DRAFT_2095446 [Clavulina sp. PMI_390]|nr:hypothetical protein DL93DRAFT_2095446 [Clavulina sp. PMI_390]
MDQIVALCTGLARAFENMPQLRIGSPELSLIKDSSKEVLEGTQRSPRTKTMAPINRMPFEILEAIFELACTDFGHSQWTSSDRSPYPPLLRFSTHKTRNAINLTCRMWREIALDAPVIWRAVPLSVKDISQIDPRLYELHYLRAHSKPLHILLSLSTSENLQPVADELAAHDRVIERLDLSIGDVPSWSSFALLEYTSFNPFLHLRQLSLRFHHDVADRLHSINLDGVPELVDLSIILPISTGSNMFSIPSLPNASFPLLRSFHLHGILEPEDIKSMLQGCADSLETFIWSTPKVNTMRIMDWFPMESVRLMQISSLICRGPMATAFLVHLTVSGCLKTLKLNEVQNPVFVPPPFDINDFQDAEFIPRCPNLFTEEISSIQTFVLDSKYNPGISSYVRAQKNLLGLHVESSALDDIFSAGRGGSSKDWDPALFPLLRWVFVEHPGTNEKKQLQALVKISAARQHPFVIFVDEESWVWWDRDFLRVQKLHPQVLRNVRWNHRQSEIDFYAKCEIAP